MKQYQIPFNIRCKSTTFFKGCNKIGHQPAWGEKTPPSAKKNSENLKLAPVILCHSDTATGLIIHTNVRKSFEEFCCPKSISGIYKFSLQENSIKLFTQIISFVLKAKIIGNQGEALTKNLSTYISTFPLVRFVSCYKNNILIIFHFIADCFSTFHTVNLIKNHSLK